MPRILLTGATGYVGGELLHILTNSNISSLYIACLVRDSAKAGQVQAAYPAIQTILGDLDDVDLVRREAEGADIVLHFASTNHIPSAQAIAQGLQARQKATQKPGYWIQISGATLFATDEIASGRFGFATDTTYDDVKDCEQVLDIIRSNPKRVVENTVLSQTSETVRTGLIIAPLIYGHGKGPVNQRSIQAPEITKSTLQRGRGFKLNDGENIWSNVHVSDLANLVCLLVSAATEGREGLWNKDGVYNMENGEMSFKELGTLIAKEAHKQDLIAKSDLETIDAGEADSLSGHASILWGTNARTKASKAREELGWTPNGEPLASTIPNMVRSESKGLKSK
ncbi:NAD dependent epimerase/dehydratase family protein [Dothidotthia symphoricarpi CBS 119687]|uniref:NAD dependent epimerase/dehydratase family protein n=1 Tax=Dothidotthia symphoricarpi CBS 119687 TaxID=1392245 RepID=A0A6A5ZZT3_9PLEO|nr:NAD dependent epimerase/dehydratase family protein [Dothidotthia symphoricarpi CBS 119687]KAF2123841.1 NAD dependent epimerase/dehydratase family protein [Dothidotthia symphoricarpi CBS 119687]